MFEKLKYLYNIEKEKRDSARSNISAGKIAGAIVVVLVIIVIATQLITPLFSAVATATSNNTLTSNAHYTSAFDLVYLIPLVFAAGIIVLIVSLMLERLNDEAE